MIGNEACGGQAIAENGLSRTIAPENPSDIEAEWLQFENEQHRQWLRMKSEIERKWQNLVVSDKKKWVAYDKTLDTRSQVDFKDAFFT